MKILYNSVCLFIGWSVDFTVLAPFLIGAICASLKSIGDLTTCQKINDANWKRPDMKNISNGIFAESIKTMSSGILGGLAYTTSSSNIGLSLATVTVLILNLLFRIGIAEKKAIELIPGEENNKKIFDFMETQGGAWTAQREVVLRTAELHGYSSTKTAGAQSRIILL